MQLPPELLAAFEKLMVNNVANMKRYDEILKQHAPCIPEGLASNIADRLASFALMGELLRQAVRKPLEEKYIADMYISFATGIAEVYNPRTWEGDVILNNLFKNQQDNDDDIN